MHEALDAAVAAVAAVQGWGDDTPALPDDGIPRRRLALNLERGGRRAAPWCFADRPEVSAISTTTLHVPDEVKARIEGLVAAQGKSAHAVMVDTLAEGTAALERRTAHQKRRRRAGSTSTAERASTTRWTTCATTSLARARGEHPPKPALRKDPAVARKTPGR